MKYLVDTCGWIEWLTDGQLTDNFFPYLEPLKQVFVPSGLFSQALKPSHLLLGGQASLRHDLNDTTDMH